MSTAPRPSSLIPSPLIPSSVRSLPMAVADPRNRPPEKVLTGTFLGISARRAYRLNIQVHEVLPQERAALESQARHISDPDQQAFLA